MMQQPGDQQQYQQQGAQAPPQQWMMPQQQQQGPAAGAGSWPGAGQQYGGGAGAGAGSDEIRSLWIGDLQPWMDESYIVNCFGQSGEALTAKVIRNKHTGLPEGYGFIEFASRTAADRALQTFNGAIMPNTNQNFRLNWATLGAGERRQEDGPEHTIFVGDLAADVTDYTLQEVFRAVYHSVKGAKVVTDRTTGRSKGYGFVRFADESEQMRAMSEMNGQYCSTRPMRVGPAATKKPIGGGPGQQFQKAPYANSQGSQGESDPNNTTIFVGGLDSSINDEMLRQVFSQFGELIHVKIPIGKRCGFVQFANRPNAEQAISMLNGTQLGGQSIRLSWGRSPANKQSPQEQSQWNGGGGGGEAYYQYTPQGYEAYGYGAPAAQGPNVYYGGYGYGNYQQQPGGYQQPQQ